MIRPLSVPIVAALLAGCAATSQTSACQGPCIGRPAADDWRQRATEDDRRRIRQWRDAWTEALGAARAGGYQAQIVQEGMLLQPDVALNEPRPPAGDYSCRVLKVGGRSDSMLDFVAYPAFRCRITADGSALRFVKLTGSQRPVGRIYEDTSRRMIFLGTLQLGDEQGVLPYGSDQERDMAGIVERIGEQRWRIVFPSPHFESLLDVIELVPAR